MSSPDTPESDSPDFGRPICDVCGCIIEELDQECPARDEGVCAP